MYIQSKNQHPSNFLIGKQNRIRIVFKGGAYEETES